MLNISSIRTPGVYIDEVPKFPPSIAAVETAIPAFIGYTEKTSFNGESFIGKAIRVTSMIDFEEKFGGAPPVNIAAVDLDASNVVQSSNMTSSYYLFDSMRMYFANGGGKCYIVTLGVYPSPFSPGDMATGVDAALSVVELEDEPTLFVIPDGIKLDPGALGSIHTKMLAQCDKYKDRFLIADVIISDPNNNRFQVADTDAFKTAIGMANLQFAGAYYPYIKVNLPREIRYRDIQGVVTKLGAPITWTSNEFVRPGDAATIALFNELEQVIADSAVLPTLQVTVGGNFSFTQLEAQYEVVKTAFQTTLAASRATMADPGSSAPDKTTARNNVRDGARDLFDYIYDVVHKFMDQVVENTAPAIGDPLLTTVRTRLTNDVQPNLITRIAIADRLLQANTFTTTPIAAPGIYALNGRAAANWEYTDGGWNTAISASPALVPGDSAPYVDVSALAGDAARNGSIDNIALLVERDADALFYGFFSAVSRMYQDAIDLENAKEAGVLQLIPVLGSVISNLKTEKFLLPPSGAVAGIYARVDSNRGVWKAPANESLVNVVAPSVKLTQDEHGELNIDSSFGKSINAIRHFTGKGNLVFGARTLAGNNNEWRYVSVRRFFNMVEESSKKATEQFVFEPNDENTWVRVQAMIENFLTTLWRQGALQGATTEQAFYVQVGLGKTMTALDILEGRMIVEIGMAVVRPAEFIILRFSHKLPEA